MSQNTSNQPQSGQPSLTVMDAQGTREVAVTDRVIIGRSSQASVQVEEKMASRQHVVVYLENGVYYARDLKSRNGTMLNGKALRNAEALRNGDVIGIGKTKMIFKLPEAALQAATSAKSAPAPQSAPAAETEAKDKTQQPYLVNADNEAIRFPLKTERATIGRRKMNAICLEGDGVSGEHAAVSRGKGEFFLEDLKSTNGTFLNGKKVEKKSVLKEGDIIQVGDTKLVFRKSAGEIKVRRSSDVAASTGKIFADDSYEISVSSTKNRGNMVGVTLVTLFCFAALGLTSWLIKTGVAGEGRIYVAIPGNLIVSGVPFEAESGNLPKGWSVETLGEGASISLNGEPASRPQGHALRLEFNSETPALAELACKEAVAIDPIAPGQSKGKTYLLQFKAKSSNLQGWAGIRITWLSTASSSLRHSELSTFVTGTLPDYVLYTSKLVPPAQADQLRVSIEGLATAGSACFDDIGLSPLEEEDYTPILQSQNIRAFVSSRGIADINLYGSGFIKDLKLVGVDAEEKELDPSASLLPSGAPAQGQGKRVSLIHWMRPGSNSIFARMQSSFGMDASSDSFNGVYHFEKREESPLAFIELRAVLNSDYAEDWELPEKPVQALLLPKAGNKGCALLRFMNYPAEVKLDKNGAEPNIIFRVRLDKSELGKRMTFGFFLGLVSANISTEVEEFFKRVPDDGAQTIDAGPGWRDVFLPGDGRKQTVNYGLAHNIYAEAIEKYSFLPDRVQEASQRMGEILKMGRDLRDKTDRVYLDAQTFNILSDYQMTKDRIELLNAAFGEARSPDLRRATVDGLTEALNASNQFIAKQEGSRNSVELQRLLKLAKERLSTAPWLAKAYLNEILLRAARGDALRDEAETLLKGLKD